MNEIRVPAPPDSVFDHDIRQAPTRISARRVGASWVVYERRDMSGIGVDAFIASRDNWNDAYVFGERLIRILDGRTVRQAETDGDIADDA